MNERYEPELGQMAFGQPWQEYAVPDYIEYILRALEAAVYDIPFREKGYVNGEELHDHRPFANTGASFKNDTFEVEAYSWDEEYEQPYNFKWRDLEISWYKYLGRGTTMNRPMGWEEAMVMLKECLESLGVKTN